MNDSLDDRIREALRADDHELLEEVGREQSLFQQMAGTLRGRNRWITALGYMYTFIFTIAAVYCGVRFFSAETERAMIAWAAGTILFALFVANLKMWFFLEMNKYAVIREVKRVELQIARLAQRLEK